MSKAADEKSMIKNCDYLEDSLVCYWEGFHSTPLGRSGWLCMLLAFTELGFLAPSRTMCFSPRTTWTCPITAICQTHSKCTAINCCYLAVISTPNSQQNIWVFGSWKWHHSWFYLQTLPINPWKRKFVEILSCERSRNHQPYFQLTWKKDLVMYWNASSAV